MEPNAVFFLHSILLELPKNLAMEFADAVGVFARSEAIVGLLEDVADLPEHLNWHQDFHDKVAIS